MTLKFTDHAVLQRQYTEVSTAVPSGLITADRPAYAGTEGCYEMLVFFFIFLFYVMRNL